MESGNHKSAGAEEAGHRVTDRAAEEADLAVQAASRSLGISAVEARMVLIGALAGGIMAWDDMDWDLEGVSADKAAEHDVEKVPYAAGEHLDGARRHLQEGVSMRPHTARTALIGYLADTEELNRRAEAGRRAEAVKDAKKARLTR